MGLFKGQTPAFQPDELEKKIEEYFVATPLKTTVCGLALFLGFASRQSVYDYKEKEDCAYIIKRALLRIQGNYELRLHGNNPTGAIFALKNMGWKDNPIIDNSKHYTTEIKIEGKNDRDILTAITNRLANRVSR